MRREDQKSKDISKAYYDKGAKQDQLEEEDEVICMLPAGDSGLTAKWEGSYMVKKDLINKPTKGKEGRRVHRSTYDSCRLAMKAPFLTFQGRQSYLHSPLIQVRRVQQRQSLSA